MRPEVAEMKVTGLELEVLGPTPLCLGVMNDHPFVCVDIPFLLRGNPEPLLVLGMTGPPGLWERSLQWERHLVPSTDSLIAPRPPWEEEEMATHSNILAWRIPWIEPGGLQSMGSHKSQTRLSD